MEPLEPNFKKKTYGAQSSIERRFIPLKDIGGQT
jgi:hypothetical protein